MLISLKPNQKERYSFSKEKIENILPKEIARNNIDTIEKYVIKAINYYKNHNK